MRRAFLIALLVAFVVPNALAEESEISRSKISIAEGIFNFGSVSQGTVVQHDFKIKNTGSTDLVIHRIVPACGCTASSASSDVIAPGAEGSIHVDFDTSGFSGEKHKTVRLYTNDLSSPTSVLTIKGVIEPDVDVSPKRLFFGDLVRGASDESSTIELTISVRNDSKATINKITSYSRYLTVKEITSGAKKRVVKVTVLPTTPLGELRERLIVSLKGSKRASINVPVFASIRGTLKLEPRTISFGIIEGEEAFVRKATLKNLGAKKIGIKSVKSTDPAVSVDYSTIKPGKVYVLKVEVDPLRYQGPARIAGD